MSLYRFNTPFVTYDDIARVFDDAFSGTVNQPSGNRQLTSATSFSPRLDVHDGPDNTTVASFELPGLKKEDVSIDFHNNVLTVSGESKSSSEHGNENYQVRERRWGKFSRSLALPEGTKPESIKASVVDGVLTVTFPKVTPEQAPKKIAIQ